MNTLSRRRFLGQAAAAAASKTLVAETLVAGQPVVDTPGPDLRIGTGGHGHTYPGATVPFGAVQLSPDTGTKGWDWASGYYLTDDSIMGFSHTHLSGTGKSDLLDFLITPRVGAIKLIPGSKEHPEEGYRSRFSHDSEQMRPGYYRVFLTTSAVTAELTATKRTGLHRYTFTRGGNAHILIDLFHAPDDPDEVVLDADLHKVGNDLLLGGRRNKCWAPFRQIYFAAQFSKPWTRLEAFSDGAPAAASMLRGKRLQAAAHFALVPGEQVLVKVGISMVSAENALANLRSEQPGWNFEGVRRQAAERWQNECARVAVKGGSERDRKIFSTSMYHMMCAPTLADDVNGEYRGMDQKVHTLAPGEHNYSTFSLWDTFRALHPSFTLWQQDRVPAMVNCLIRMAEESPAGIPIWPLQGAETFCMTGYHSASVMAEACSKKFPRIDWARAYAVMRKRNMDDDYQGLGYYRTLGFIPADKMGESVSKLIEYDYGDWACSKVAEQVGRDKDVSIQRPRSRNYRHLFDPGTQFIRAKMSDGTWAPDFNPRATGHSTQYRDYTESNAWQTTFGVQHDVASYIELFGGREAFVKKLDALFVAEPGVSNENVLDMSGFIGQYVHGNEPSHHIAFLYMYAGQPWKTQQRVKQILDTLYQAEPDGLAGNEDCGQMSAWFFMAAIGLYAVDPVSANYVLVAPRFDDITVRTQAKPLRIRARRVSKDSAYIQSVALNGVPLDRLWVSHDEIGNGARLDFVLGPEPNLLLGVEPGKAPPSMSI